MLKIRRDSVLNGQRTDFPFMGSDSFGRLRTSSPFTQLDLKMVADDQSLLYDTQITGTGSSQYNAGQASVSLSVGNGAGSAIRQSKLRGIYQPGKSLFILCTGVLGNQPDGVTSRIGYFDSVEGFYFKSSGGQLSIVKRTSISGEVVETEIPQNHWNVDTLDGTEQIQNPSGVHSDFSKTQIFGFDLEWLGVGSVRIFCVVNGVFVPVHIFNHANLLPTVYMGNPNLPIRWEIEGNVPATLTQICGTVISEGGLDNNVRSTYVSRNGESHSMANQDLYSPVLSIRLKESHYSARTLVESIDALLTSTGSAEWRLFFNPTVAGIDTAEWVDVPNSAIQYDISRTNLNLLTGGAIFAGGYLSSGNQIKTATNARLSSLLTLGTGINIANRDELVLGIANIEGNGGTAYGGILVREFN